MSIKTRMYICKIAYIEPYPLILIDYGVISLL